FSRIKSIKNFIKKNEYDIVHSWHWSSDWTEVLAARWAGAKWIYTKKAMSWGNRHWKIRSFLAHFIITINDEMRDYFPKKKNQKLIPLGIDTIYYYPKLFPQKLNANETFNIITVANLVPVKGIEILLKALKMCNDPAIKLTVLGDNSNEYGQFLTSACKQLNIDEQVNFLGKKVDVRPFIAASDLYVIPTLNEGRKEGMPMALVEAMCMGIPVLGSNISGINFVLKDFKNLLFEAGNDILLSEKILEVKKLSERERIKLGNELREYIIVNFNYIKFIEAHLKLYNQLIKLR